MGRLFVRSTHLPAMNFDKPLAVAPFKVVVSLTDDIGHPGLGLTAHCLGDFGLRPADGLQVTDQRFPVHDALNRNCAYLASANALMYCITIAI